jgi:hypothetical protein
MALDPDGDDVCGAEARGVKKKEYDLSLTIAGAYAILLRFTGICPSL